MPEAEHIEDWRGREVRDTAGDSLGKLDEVYFDPESRKPVLIAIKSGLLGRRSRLVPLADATVAPDHVRVAYPAATIEDADAQELPTGDEEFSRLGAVYGVRFRDGLQLTSATPRPRRLASEPRSSKRPPRPRARSTTPPISRRRTRVKAPSRPAEMPRRPNGRPTRLAQTPGATTRHRPGAFAASTSAPTHADTMLCDSVHRSCS
jgi:hypothetical protein